MGRSEKVIEAVVVGEVSMSDLGLLDGPKTVVTSPIIKRLSERHHALARIVASGVTLEQASGMTGYTPERISALKMVPAFRDLVRHYETKLEAAYFDLHERLAGLSVDAADLLRDRMEDEPEKIGSALLLEIMKAGADRTGHGPAATAMNLNVNMNLAEKLEAARKRVAASQQGSGTESSPDPATAPLRPMED